jgi:hypothetical protein
MEKVTDQRIARTEALFRDVNERIAESAEGFGSEDASFVCECSDASCTHRVDATLESYEEVREDGATFIVVDGHERDDVERVVRRRGPYSIVEKVKPKVRELVLRLNPRASPS